MAPQNRKSPILFSNEVLMRCKRPDHYVMTLWYGALIQDGAVKPPLASRAEISTQPKMYDKVLTFKVPVNAGERKPRVPQLQHNVCAAQEAGEGAGELRHMAWIP